MSNAAWLFVGIFVGFLITMLGVYIGYRLTN